MSRGGRRPLSRGPMPNLTMPPPPSAKPSTCPRSKRCSSIVDAIAMVDHGSVAMLRARCTQSSKKPEEIKKADTVAKVTEGGTRPAPCHPPGDARVRGHVREPRSLWRRAPGGVPDRYPHAACRRRALPRLHRGHPRGQRGVLPESIFISACNLPAFITLDQDGCISLASLPDRIGDLTGLTALGLTGCSSLVLLSDWVGDLPALTKLDLTGYRLQLVDRPPGACEQTEGPGTHGLGNAAPGQVGLFDLKKGSYLLEYTRIPEPLQMVVGFTVLLFHWETAREII